MTILTVTVESLQIKAKNLLMLYHISIIWGCLRYETNLVTIFLHLCTSTRNNSVGL